MINVIALNAISQPWPELIPLDELEAPTIDLSLIPSWAGDYAREISRSLEVPPEAVITAILASIATAVQRDYKVAITPQHIEIICIWLLTAIESGGRKSSTLKLAQYPIIEWLKKVNETRKQAIKDYQLAKKIYDKREAYLVNQLAKADETEQEQIKADLNKHKESQPKEIFYAKKFTTDCTPEQIGALMYQNDEVISWLSSEANLFTILGGIYSGGVTNLDIFNCGQAGDYYQVDRGGRELTLYSPKLTIGLMPQPNMMLGVFEKNKQAIDSGLLNRFLYFVPSSNLGYRSHKTPPINEEVKQRYFDGLTMLLNTEPKYNEQGRIKERIIYPSSEAKQLLDQWRDELEVMMRPNGELAEFKSWGSKATDQAGRIAALFHCIRYTTDEPEEMPISKKDMENAISLVRQSIPHLQKAFHILGGNPKLTGAVKLLEHLRVKFKDSEAKQTTAREIYQAKKKATGFKSMEDVNSYLDILMERGYIKVVTDQGENGGKPTQVVIVRPDLWGKHQIP